MTVDLPSVLVLLATHNGEKWLEHQIATVLGQRGVNVSIMIRDDASIDNTVALASGLAEGNARIQLLKDSHLAGSASANFFHLIEAAKLENYDFVALCDQDDIWLPAKLKRAIDQLTLNDADGYSSTVAALWPDGHRTNMAQNRSMTRGDYLFEGGGQGCTFVITAAWAARLQVILRNEARPLLQAIHYHDWAIYALSRSLHKRWIFDNEIALLYRQHANNDTGARASVIGVRYRIGRVRSGWYKSQVLAICQLMQISNPFDRTAAQWLKWSKDETHHRYRLRWEKSKFIFKAGRRRWSDRLIQIAAVLLGCL